MKKFLDLRFVIGIFFILIGLLVLIYALVKLQNRAIDRSVNLWSSSLFLTFGGFMIVISLTKEIIDE